MEQRLKELREQQVKLNDLLTANKQEQRDILSEMFMREQGYYIGDLVEWFDGSVKKTGEISSIEFFGDVKPIRFKARLQTLKGVFFKSETTITNMQSLILIKGGDVRKQLNK